MPDDTLNQPASPAPASGAEIIPFHARITERCGRHLGRWLEAGRPMGLLDAEIYAGTEPGAPFEQGCVLIWVRETSSPAYLVLPEARHWVVVDSVRDVQLGEFASFEAALHFIRPVLPAPVLSAPMPPASAPPALAPATRPGPPRSATPRPSTSPLLLSDRLLALAEEADQEGDRPLAEHLIQLLYDVLDMPQEGQGQVPARRRRAAARARGR